MIGYQALFVSLVDKRCNIHPLRLAPNSLSNACTDYSAFLLDSARKLRRYFASNICHGLVIHACNLLKYPAINSRCRELKRQFDIRHVTRKVYFDHE